MKKRFVLFAFVATLFLCNFALLEAGEELREEVLREAPKAWVGYLKELRNIETTEKSETRLADGTLFGTSKSSWTLSFPFVLRTTEATVDGGSEKKLFIVNPNYSAVLESSSDSEKPWTIVKIEKVENGSLSKRKFPVIDNFSNHNPRLDLPQELQLQINLAHALEFDDLLFFPSFWNEKDFKILEITESIEDVGRVVRLDFLYRPEGVVGTVGPPVLQNGSVWLLPDRCWVIKKASYDSLQPPDRTEKDHFETEIEYRTPIGQIPLPSKITRKMVSQHEEFSGETVIEYDWKQGIQPHDKKEYYLSYYGLPEPEFGTGAKWVRPALVLIGLLVLFVAYRFMSHRKDATDTGGKA